MKIILYSISILLIASCNSPKSAEKARPNTDNSGVTIVYQQTACFGKCPVFTMTVKGESKMMWYNGQQNVSKMGLYTKSILNDSITKLVSMFDKANFFDLNDKYMSTVTDFPSAIITYTKNWQTKKIEDRHDGPPQLKEIEKLLFDISKSDGWEKREEGK